MSPGSWHSLPVVELELVPEGDGTAAEAARRAATRAGLGAVPARFDRGPWWRAGIGESVENRPGAPGPAPYGVAPSPRSTRGATRA